ncbi:MAG: DUF2062 domain-containing protein [Proteobacteria bacterium]|nr:DUF2062 domain-containing protein [Pseudomonadota bacterium]
MFKSKKKRNISFYIKEICWPSMGWKRAARYVALRVMRLSVASNAVPRGFACGITASFFPVLGTHALIAAAMAFVIRANAVAAVLGTLVFPPIILPIIFSFDFLVGKNFLQWTGLYITPAHAGSTTTLENIEGFMIPATAGAILLMLAVWPLSYFATKKAIDLFRQHRQKVRP